MLYNNKVLIVDIDIKDEITKYVEANYILLS